MVDFSDFDGSFDWTRVRVGMKGRGCILVLEGVVTEDGAGDFDRTFENGRGCHEESGLDLLCWNGFIPFHRYSSHVIFFSDDSVSHTS